MIVLKAAQEKLLNTLQAVSGIVERRHTLPILANVLIRKTGSEIEFTTSDLEIQVRTVAEFDGDESDYATTVGARKLIDILRALPTDQAVTLTQSNLDVEIPKQEVILPRKTVLELQRLLKDEDTPIEMRFAGNQAKFSFSGMEFVSKLVEGKFPDYNRVIPKNHKNHVTLGRAPLLSSLQRAA